MSSHQLLHCELCLEFQRYVNRVDANGIYVSDLPHNMTEDDLYRFFRNYGQIADFFFADSGQYCLVHFEHRGPVDELVSFPPFLLGKQISIRNRFVSKADNNRTASLNLVSSIHERVLKSISEKEAFQEQVQVFLNVVTADVSLIEKQEIVCKDLENALKHISSIYKIKPFGSTMNGLALKDSDLDVYYGRGKKVFASYNQKVFISIFFICPFLFYACALSAELSGSAYEVRDTFRKVKVALEKNDLFSSLKPIPGARVPIIKFVHKTTGINCDLSFRNTFGVQNSKLIKFLISLDSRIKPFFIIVKYWARLHSMTGKRLSNYALIMLLINFLQSLNDPILPPLKDFQHEGVPARKVGVWNTGFDDDVTRLRPVSNDLPVEELLSRFFESVGKTDFANYVVCPFLGSLVHKNSFYTPSRLPPELKEYIHHVRAGAPPLKVESVLCLQDPFELNLNVTKNLAKHDFQCFKEHCEVAARLSYSVPPHQFLSHLLSTTYLYPRKNCTKKTWLPNPMHLRPLRPYLTLNIPSPENLTDKILWSCEQLQKIILILKKVLKIHVDKDKRMGERKPGDDQTLKCKGSQVLWENRDKLWKRWYKNKNENVEVFDISEQDEITDEENHGAKRKRTEKCEGTSKKRKIEPNENEESDHAIDLITIDAEEDIEGSLEPRSIQQEIELTNNMVRQGHALPAAEFILDFTCSFSKVKNGACIELSDHRSRNNYFSSLCIFLEGFLSTHLTETSTT